MKTKEFDDKASSIIFPQIMKFMHCQHFIQGEFFTKIVENGIFDIKKIESISKVFIDCEGLKKVFGEHASSEDKYTLLQADLMITIARRLFVKILPSGTLPKRKNYIFKEIGHIIKGYSSSKEITRDHQLVLTEQK